MEKISFRVADYEGPLDLLLHLISKNKLDIAEIDISSLLDQYIQTIRLWQQADLDVSSEFLEMASRLVYMKTVSLLPRREEEDRRLRGELSGQLIEYSLCKLAAGTLRAQDRSGDVFVRAPKALFETVPYNRRHSPDVLYDALRDALGKGRRRLPPRREEFASLVTAPFISVTSRVFLLLRSLRRANRIDYRELFAGETARSGMVATFLALLELVKSKRVTLEQEEIILRE